MLGGFLSPNSSTPVGVGNVVVDAGANTWVPWNQAIASGLTPGYQIGFAMKPAVPGGALVVAVDDAIPYASWNLRAGTAGPIYAGNTPSRSGSTQIGICDVSGAIIIQPSLTLVLPTNPISTTTLTGTSTAGAVPTNYVATIPVCPSGGNPATFVGLVHYDIVIEGRTIGSNNWAIGRVFVSVYNTGGAVDTGDTTGTFPNANPSNNQLVASTGVVTAGGISLGLGTTGGNFQLALKFPTLAGGPTIQWTVTYITYVAT